MADDTSGRRRFLKSGAALAGLTLAPAATLLSPRSASSNPLAAGAEPGANEDLNALDAVLYGRRSRFVTTVRSLEGRSNPDMMQPRPVGLEPRPQG